MAISPAIPKFVGTISLGLLTGLSYTLTTLLYPSTLSLPSAHQASKSATDLRARTTFQTRILATLSALSLTTAYLLSPPRARHPYLLWTALLSAGSCAGDVVRLVSGRGKEGIGADGEEGGGNGEMVERDVRREQRGEMVRLVVAGLGFGVGVVGLWGDGA